MATRLTSVLATLGVWLGTIGSAGADPVPMGAGGLPVPLEEVEVAIAREDLNIVVEQARQTLARSAQLLWPQEE